MANIVYKNPNELKAINIMNNVSSITDIQVNTFSYMKTDLLYVNRIVDPDGTGSDQENNSYTTLIAIAPLSEYNTNSNENPIYNDCGAIGLINNSQGVSLDFTTVETPLNGSTAYEQFPYNYVGSNLNYELNKAVYDTVVNDEYLNGTRGINFRYIKYIPVVTVTDIDFENNIELETNLDTAIFDHVKKLFWWDYIRCLDGTYKNNIFKFNDGKIFDIKQWRYIISVELMPVYSTDENVKYIIPNQMRTPYGYISFENLDYRGLDNYLVFSDDIETDTEHNDSLKSFCYVKNNKLKITEAITDTIPQVFISEMFDDRGRAKAQIVQGKYQSNNGERTLINAKLGTNSAGVLVYGCPDSYQPMPFYDPYNSPINPNPNENLIPEPTVIAMPFIPAYNLKAMAEKYNQNTNNKNILFTNTEFKKFYCNGTTVVNVTNRPSSSIPKYNYFTVPYITYDTGYTEKIDVICYAINILNKDYTINTESVEYLQKCCYNTQLQICFDVDDIINPETGEIWTPATDPRKSSVIMDSNGVIHRGTDDDFYNFLDIPNYTPKIPPDPDKYSDDTELTRPSITGASVFNNMYAMTYNAINLLAEGLWNLDSTQIGSNLALMGANPIDSIVSLRLYPFAISGGQITTVKVGTIDFGINGILVDDSQMQILDLGSVFLDYRTPDELTYLDFEPYTMLELYVPYCGKIPLSSAQFMNHNINVKLCVDYNTGACVGIVFRDDIAVHYLQGEIGVDIQITGRNASQQQIAVAQHLMSGLGNLSSGALNVLSSPKNLMSTGTPSIEMFDENYNTYSIGGSMNLQGLGISQFSSGAGKLAKGVFDIKTAPQYKTYVERVGSATPACSLYEPKYCYITVQRCDPMYADSNYESLSGYACSMSDIIENFHGFTQFGSVRLDHVPCTLDEKNMLIELFNQGVYLP